MISAWVNFYVTKKKWKKIFASPGRTLLSKMALVKTFDKNDVYFLLSEVDGLRDQLKYTQKELDHDERAQAALCFKQRIAELEIDQMTLIDKLKKMERTDGRPTAPTS